MLRKGALLLWGCAFVMGGVLFLVTSFPALNRGIAYVIIALKMVAGLAGCDIVGHIHLRDRETGKEYK